MYHGPPNITAPVYISTRERHIVCRDRRQTVEAASAAAAVETAGARGQAAAVMAAVGSFVVPRAAFGSRGQMCRMTPGIRPLECPVPKRRSRIARPQPCNVMFRRARPRRAQRPCAGCALNQPTSPFPIPPPSFKMKTGSWPTADGRGRKQQRSNALYFV